MSTPATAPSGATPPGLQLTLTFDEALVLAIARHQAGRLDDAGPVYAALLERAPQRVDVLSPLGILHHQCGDHATALLLMRRAVDLVPQDAGLWNNLGNVLMELEKLDEAEPAFQRSLELADNAEAHANLARVSRSRNDWPGSEQCARRALALAPELGEALHSLALALLGQAKYAQGAEAAIHALPFIPTEIRNRDFYARVLLMADERAHAAAVYRAWLDLEPDNPYARHHLAACTGQDAPDRASGSYVEHVFDKFAETFDAQLAKLHYCAPELVAKALGTVLPAPARQFDIADLGCGTGLCGPLVRDWARRLWGCDLSLAMMERAAQREVYDELHKADLIQFLDERPRSFDALIAADTLIYFGELAGFAHAAQRALRAGGHLVFTVEGLEEGAKDGSDEAARDYALGTSGRYAHRLDYVRAVLAAAGFATRAVTREVMREEFLQPVHGWVVTASLEG